MVINISGGSITKQEEEQYVKRAAEKYGDSVESLNIEIDGDDVTLTYNLTDAPFERIRRITGYLASDLSRWNDAKKAEEKDRVKHA